MKNGKYSHLKGEIALVIWMFLGSLMGVIIRFLNNYFQTFQQIFLRTFFAFFLSAVIYHFLMGGLNFKKLNKRDFIYILLRAIIVFSAISFYVLAIINTNLANVGFIGALPTTAIIGIVVFKEKISVEKLLYLFISMIGVSLILIKDISNFSIGIGELFAIISAFLFSIGFLFRKKISSKIGDKEISIINTFFISFFAFLITIFFENDFISLFSKINNISFLLLILSAFVFVCISYLIVYGFKRVDAITASNIEFLEAVFSLILGFIIFSEIPTFIDLIGGILIVLGAYFMIKAKKGRAEIT